jgi:hypothetical protein
MIQPRSLRPKEHINRAIRSQFRAVTSSARGRIARCTPWGLSLNAISFIAVPIIAAWCALSVWLGRKQRALADAQHRPEAGPAEDVAAAKPA